VKALGYSAIQGDVEVETVVEGGTTADYILHAGGKEAIVIEAKRLGLPLESKHGAQVI
jgi:hypothetical protein